MIERLSKDSTTVGTVVIKLGLLDHLDAKPTGRRAADNLVLDYDSVVVCPGTGIGSALRGGLEGDGARSRGHRGGGCGRRSGSPAARDQPNDIGLVTAIRKELHYGVAELGALIESSVNALKMR